MHGRSLDDIILNNFTIGLESKRQFYSRVRRDFSKLSLDGIPFDVNESIIECTWEIVKHEPVGSRARAESLFYWIKDNILYCAEKPIKYRTASQVFRDGTGVCVDMSFLYIAMARIAGINSKWVDVLVDNMRKKVDHACAVVYPNDCGKIFVDPAYRLFEVNHKDIRLYNDLEVINYYNKSCAHKNIDGFVINNSVPMQNYEFSNENPVFMRRYAKALTALCSLIGLVFYAQKTDISFSNIISEVKGFSMFNSQPDENINRKIHFSRYDICQSRVEYLKALYPNNKLFTNFVYNSKNCDIADGILIDAERARISRIR